MTRSPSVLAAAAVVSVALLAAASMTLALNDRNESSSDLDLRLRDVDDARGLTRLVSHLRSEPLYARESAGNELVALLDDCSMLTWREEVAPTATHDPRMLCGRAATLLESVFGFAVPTIDATSNEAERRASQGLARLQMAAYSTGIRDARIDAGLGVETKESLKRRFQTKILSRVPDTDQSGLLHWHGLRAFEGLLQSWYPIGKRMDDLESIVGKPAEQLSPDSQNGVESYRYLFFHPMAGSEIVFQVQDGIIRSVAARAGE
ncbi:MAG: hypothetical protein GY715_17460 [Planctomycetes bacterium]|nr:hypothetical protein [Planctomycetota bacterium]